VSTPNDHFITLRHFNLTVHEIAGISQILLFISHKNDTQATANTLNKCILIMKVKFHQSVHPGNFTFYFFQRQTFIA